MVKGIDVMNNSIKSKISKIFIIIMIFIIGFSSVPVANADPLTFLQTSGDGTNLTTYTFSAENLGAANAERYIIVGVTGRSSDGGARTLSSVTVGGVGATINVQVHSSGNTAAVAIAKVPTGTTGDVVLVWSSTMGNADIGLWRVTDVTSTTANDTLSSTADPPSDTINVNADGIVIAISKSDAGGDTTTWAGITEDFDAADSAGNNYSGASDTFESEQVGLTVTSNWGTEVRPVLAGASFDITFVAPAEGVVRQDVIWFH